MNTLLQHYFKFSAKKVGCTTKKGRCSNFVVALQTPTLSFVKVCEEPLKNGSIFAPKTPCWKICFFNLAIDGVVVFLGLKNHNHKVELKICKKSLVVCVGWFKEGSSLLLI